MKRRILTGIILGLLLLAGWVFWPSGSRPAARLDRAVAPQIPLASATIAGRPEPQITTQAQAKAPNLFSSTNSSQVLPPPTNQLAYRVSNTARALGDLLRDDRAVLLENALIDTTQPLALGLPAKLRAEGEPGSYIVQARGGADGAFQRLLTGAGAQLVSYIPNEAWLVRATAPVVQRLAGNARVQAVLPWEPYFKLKADLLPLAVQDKPLAPDAKLNLLVYADAQSEVSEQLAQMQVSVLQQERSPFGTVVTVEPPADWLALARMPGVQILEQAFARVSANDLTRVRLGVTTNTVTGVNHLGLTGSNVLVSLNDSGVDHLHPDLAGRVFGFVGDTDGHGTHVAGIIVGSGLMSTNVTNARGSVNPAVTNQFRGMAPGARLFSQELGVGLNGTPDQTLQEGAARTNAFISNNSWVYLGNSTYSLAAASYDAAVRDSLPGVPGSQPVLYVFSAGNTGQGGDDGLGGSPGSVRSPATAKNVISVGALELPRDITNIVTKITGDTTNTSTPWKSPTSSQNQVAGFSARGNVGIGVEGPEGRFKPDLVAPGTFVISTRSTEWDEVAYYNPTNYQSTLIENQVVTRGSLSQYVLFLPENAVGFSIQLVPNEDSPFPFPNLPLYVRRDGAPTATQNDIARTNAVAVPTDLPGLGANVGQNWFYGIGTTSTNPIRFDIFTTVITTNDLGDYYTVLSNLNNSISSTNATPGVPPNYYRYESGTSMAAPAVAGTLALMQEFFEQGLRTTNSPALMKALLINGARSAGNLYDFQVRSSINYQGWGVARLDNTLQPGITNAFTLGASANPNSIYALDQSPTNALSTGQSRTWTFNVDEEGQTLPLRVTLAWTDPPGNPAAGVKLVNDLDLIVTNNVTGEVYFGNDFPSGSRFTFGWDTNEVANVDSVNNIENVYLPAPLDTNYTIVVRAKRVNVNAVTAHPDNIVQDFALVISSGAGEAPQALQLAGTPTLTVDTNLVPDITSVSNSLVAADFSSAYLLNQRVGANSPLLGTTNGQLSQWKFYIITNTTSFTNASFLVSQQTDLAVPRQGVFSADRTEATRRYADIDLYVSTDANLLTLDPVTLAASQQSRTRNDLSGDEYVIYDDSVQNRVYYIAVKSEDQMGGQFEFWGIFSLLPLGEEEDGFVRAYPMAGYPIPDGTPSNPGGTRFVAITRSSLSGVAESVRRVLVTNNIVHENFSDLINTMDHNTRVVVLDNHRAVPVPPFPNPPGPYRFLYDDSGEGDFLNGVPPEGPGSFEQFIGEAPGGTWYFTYSDDALTQTGRVNDVRLRIERQLEDDRETTNTVAANSWIYFSRNVPVEATNLTICLDIISPTPGPLQLYVRKGGRPTPTAYDYFLTINPPGGCLVIDQTLLPPLSAGRYFIGIFNPNPTQQTFVYSARLGLGLPPTPLPFSGGGNIPLLDDAVTNYSVFITNSLPVATVDVGLRLDHPRVSDLAITLISPRGTRVLLFENRGGTDTNGFGSTLTVTNFVPVAANGGQAGQTNFVETGAISGVATIDYTFFNAPDQMTVYYDGNLLADTGLISGSGRLRINYGPGTSTVLEIRMNVFGNPSPDTLWNYSVSSVSELHSYLVFTESTNLTTTPIKFAAPPFVGLAGTNYLVSGFEPPTLAQDYFGPSVGVPDGWSLVNSNRVSVITNTAYAGSNSLALRSGIINRLIDTAPGRSYRLGYAYRQRPSLEGLVSWWPGEVATAAFDIVDGNNGAAVGSPGSGAGMVGLAFDLNGLTYYLIPDAPNLDFTNAITLEAWVYPRAVGGGFHEVLSKWGGPGQRSYTFSIAPDGRGYLTVCSDGTLNVASVFSASQIPANQWSHLAATYDGSSLRFYFNGVLQGITPWGNGFFPGAAPLVLGATLTGPASATSFFNGLIDEAAVFRRALNPAEVLDIYLAGMSGKCGMIIPPDVCANSSGAMVAAFSLKTNSFLGTQNWQSGGVIFTATSTNTLIQIEPGGTNLNSGVLLDQFTLTELVGHRYVLPEESLKALEGENAFGQWRLEILDTRTGASNNVNLVDWQLSFVFQTNTTAPRVLTPGVPVTRTLPPGQITYFLVDVPSFANYATNVLFNASVPVSFYFNQLRPPSLGASNVLGGDIIFAANVQNHTEVLSAPAIIPPTSTRATLQPGQRYYLAVENTSAVNATFTIYVDFDLAVIPPFIQLTNGVPYCTINPTPLAADYYRYAVSSNAVRAQFDLRNLTGDMTLVLRRGLPPTLSFFDYISANVFTNDEVITVFDFTQPVPLAPGDWYFAAVNLSDGPVAYCATAHEWASYGTNLVITNVFLGTNSLCLSWTSLLGVPYVIEGVTNLTSTNWVAVAPTVFGTGDVTTYCVALPSPYQFFRVREGQALNPYFPPPTITRIRQRFNGIEITWSGPPGQQYQVEWSPGLFPPVWTPFTEIVTSTTGVYQYLDDGSQTGGFGGTRYYRLVLLP